MSNNKNEATGHNPGSNDPYDHQADPGSGYAPPGLQTFTSKPKKKKRVFMWFFISVQLLFILWLIFGGKAAADSTDCSKQVTEYFSLKDCESARAAGTGIGLALVLVLWAIVDFLLAVTYIIIRLARR